MCVYVKGRKGELAFSSTLLGFIFYADTIKGSTGRERAMRVSAAVFVVEDEERVGRHYEEGGVSTEEKYVMGVSQDASFCCLPLQSSSAFLLPTGESKAGKANSTIPNNGEAERTKRSGTFHSLALAWNGFFRRVNGSSLLAEVAMGEYRVNPLQRRESAEGLSTRHYLLKNDSFITYCLSEVDDSLSEEGLSTRHYLLKNDSFITYCLSEVDDSLSEEGGERIKLLGRP
ncbi:hypothetical protein SAY86_022860 [Trapa natans]|uniref:Uncharacterized protein n=1 Tax=Trapa natans TaxID=22666 RepID=A0AAN7R8S8_TRANT|nr:hypothetical protein SAY86_022860 [Trapa natans]